MAYVYLDETKDGVYSVRVLSGLRGDKRKDFDDLKEARAYALKKMGRRGMVVDTTAMTPEQLKAHKEREARQQAALEALAKEAGQ